MPGDRQTPAVRLRRLAAEPRSLRTSSGLTRDEIVERTGINVATLYRLEHARVRPQTRTLRTLLDLYGVEKAHQGELTFSWTKRATPAAIDPCSSIYAQ
jgi:transcriptional regulator with XRE-family HTH domain